MKLLHVAPFYEPAWAYGGMARSAAGLARAQAAAGDDVTVVTARLDPRHPCEERAGGVRILRFEGPEFLRDRLLPWSRQLGRFLQAEAGGFDIAHVHGHRSGLAWTARRVLGRKGVAYVLQTHGTFPHHGQRRLAKLLFDRAAGDAIVAGAALLLALSQAEARDLPRLARIVPNGVEAHAAPAAARARGGSRLLFVGSDRFRRKRADLLPRLLAALPGATLTLVGSFSDALRRTLSGRAEFLGALDGAELAAAYASGDVLVHPAVGEAFGLVPFEAGLCGTPAVVANGHGCGEWYARAGGCTVPCDDFDALVAAVRTRLERPALGQAEVRAVAAFTRAELTWERAAGAVAEAYREVLAGARA